MPSGLLKKKKGKWDSKRKMGEMVLSLLPQNWSSFRSGATGKVAGGGGRRER